jgi:hypothetical protein
MNRKNRETRYWCFWPVRHEFGQPLVDVVVVMTQLKELKLEVTWCAIPLRLIEEDSRKEGQL